MAMTFVKEEALERPSACGDDLDHVSAPLIVGPAGRKYNMQYSSLYDFRLKRLKHPKGRLLALAHQRWAIEQDEEQSERQASGSGVSGASYVRRILDVQQGAICFVIGTIYCSMHLKPDVLEELTREQYLPPQPASASYADPDSDEFFVEDESGRVRLVGDSIAPDGHLRSSLVTGVVAAILGTETRAGDFEVADIIFAGVPPPKKPVKSEDSTMDAADSAENWVALVSGLELDVIQDSVATRSAKAHDQGSEESDDKDMFGSARKEIRSMLLVEWLLGAAGDDEARQDAAHVVSLIIAGNSLSPSPKDESYGHTSGRSTTLPPAPDAFPTAGLDDFLSDLTSTMPVFLMPGQTDPTSISMPQQPIHFALLPQSARFSSLHRKTNPAWIGALGKKFLGTSGQNIDDIYKYLLEPNENARLEAACHTLDWGHVCPTAPDTISCYPLNDRDPFLIEETPDVYFVGNQDHFATRIYNGPDGHRIRVVLLPRFSTSGQVVLVNPTTLECKVVEIGPAKFAI